MKHAISGDDKMSFRYGRKSCRFQVLSDLHLEVEQQYNHFNLRAKAPNLILAEDIGRLIDYDEYLAVLTRESKQFERVFLVLGNHEFYGTSRAEGLRKAQQLVKESEVHLLERMIYKLTDSDVIVLGCTLHSFITREQRDMVHYRIQDFQKIQDWTIDEHNSQHEQDVMWLRYQITTIQQRKNGGNKRILIATHHAPAVIGTSRPEHSKNEWNSAFSTELIGNAEFAEFSKTLVDLRLYALRDLVEGQKRESHE